MAVTRACSYRIVAEFERSQLAAHYNHSVPAAARGLGTGSGRRAAFDQRSHQELQSSI